MATNGTSFSAQQSLAAAMGASSQETHTVSPLDELMALKTLKDMAGDNKADQALWQGYINDSTRMLRVAAHTIKTQPAISEKLGVSGLQGVLALASLMKQKHADAIFDKVIENGLQSGAEAMNLETPDQRLKRMNRLRVKRDPRTGRRVYGATD